MQKTPTMTLHVCPLSAVEQTSRQIGATHLMTLLREHSALSTPSHIQPDRHLRIEVNDIDEPQDGMIHPVEEHIASVLSFARSWDREAPMLVHCWAGISRSTAAAFMTLCMLNPHTKEHRIAQALREASPTASPNRLMIRLADTALSRGGRMVSAIEDIGRGEPALEAVPFALPARFGR